MNDNVENAVVKLMKCYHKIFRAKKNHQPTKKIMIINFYKLGDMVCTVPLIREIRKNFPTAEITLVCSPEVYNYVELMPYVDNVYCYQRITSGKHIFERQVVDAYRFVEQNFAHDIFDFVILTGWLALPREILMACFMKTTKIVAYYRQGDDVLLSNTSFKGSICDVHHQVQRTLNIIKSMGGEITNDELELWCDEDDRETVEKLLIKENITDSRMKAVVFLSTSALQKDWAVENFVEVCNRLQKKYSAQIILLGAKSDTEEYGKKFASMFKGVINLIGRTTIRQTGLIMKKADVYLGGDTGTLHLAAACKLPGVVVVKDYAGAHPLMGAPMDVFYPWKSPIRIVRPEKPLAGCEICCETTQAHCINQVTPDMVWHELDDVVINEVLNRTDILEDFNNVNQKT